jgi:hypothetical protein
VTLRIITFVGWMIAIWYLYRGFNSIIDDLLDLNPITRAVRPKTTKVGARVVSIVFKFDKDCVYIVGDLLEEYGRLRPELGFIKARLWLYNQALNSVLPVVWKALLHHTSRRLSKWFHRHGN